MSAPRPAPAAAEEEKMSMFSAADGADDGGHDHPELKSFGDTIYAASLMPATPPHPTPHSSPPRPPWRRGIPAFARRQHSSRPRRAATLPSDPHPPPRPRLYLRAACSAVELCHLLLLWDPTAVAAAGGCPACCDHSASLARRGPLAGRRARGCRRADAEGSARDARRPAAAAPFRDAAEWARGREGDGAVFPYEPHAAAQRRPLALRLGG